MNTDSAMPGLNRENALLHHLCPLSKAELDLFKRGAGGRLSDVRELQEEIADLTRTCEDLAVA